MLGVTLVTAVSERRDQNSVTVTHPESLLGAIWAAKELHFQGYPLVPRLGRTRTYPATMGGMKLLHGVLKLEFALKTPVGTSNFYLEIYLALGLDQPTHTQRDT